MNILISNNVSFHYEIIESIIKNYYKILGINKDESHNIYLFLVADNNESPPGINFDFFKRHISETYPTISIIDDTSTMEYDYQIHCTAQPSWAKETHGGIRPKDMSDDLNIKYIAHYVDEELLSKSNVIFLSNFGRKDIPLDRVHEPDIIQYSNTKIKSSIPIFIVQGSFVRSAFDLTRDFSVIEEILLHEYSGDFLIKFVGRWNQENFNLFNFINLHKINKKNLTKIDVRLNQNWNDFCYNFVDAYAVIPSISKEKNPQYFYNEMTSSFTYIKSHGLNVLAEPDFFISYNIDIEKSYPYQNSIRETFQKMLDDFYNREDKNV